MSFDCDNKKEEEGENALHEMHEKKNQTSVSLLFAFRCTGV